MHPYLTRLGVRPEVQQFFGPYFSSDAVGNLVFPYGDSIEHFGFAFHRVPASTHFWIAGDTNFDMIRQVMIGASAMDAIAWLNQNYSTFSNMDNLLLLSTGTSLNAAHSQWIGQNLNNKIVTLIFSKDFLGRIVDLKLAGAIRRMPVAISLAEKEIQVIFRFKQYAFQQDKFSLSAFEKAAKYHFNIRTQKPKNFDAYFDLLKANTFAIA
jgi:hypothetical protein